MSTYLDIDDVCAGNSKAMQELADMRDRIEQLHNLLAEARYFMVVGHAPFCTLETLIGQIDSALEETPFHDVGQRILS